MAQPGSVPQHPHPWCRQEPHLGRQLAALFATIIEFVSEVAVEKHHCFADGQTVLGSAEAQHVHARLPSDGLGRDLYGGDGIGETRAIHVDAQFAAQVLFAPQSRLMHRRQLGH